jgi:hypothetical protein
MPYIVKDYGLWKPYTPDPIPAWAQQAITIGGAVVFLQRASDGKDFYEFRGGNPFATDAVVAATMVEGPNSLEIVKSAFRDTSMIFPANQRLIEINGVDPSISDLDSLFVDQVYDPAARTFSPPPPPPPPSACSRLGLRRALNETGQWQAVKALIEADPNTQEEWDLATILYRTDPLVKRIQAAMHLSDDQVTQIIRRAVALVQPAA